MTNTSAGSHSTARDSLPHNAYLDTSSANETAWALQGLDRLPEPPPDEECGEVRTVSVTENLLAAGARATLAVAERIAEQTRVSREILTQLAGIQVGLGDLTEEVRAASVAVYDGPDRHAIDLANLRGELAELRYGLEHDLAAEEAERKEAEQDIRDEQEELYKGIGLLRSALNGRAT